MKTRAEQRAAEGRAPDEPDRDREPAALRAAADALCATASLYETESKADQPSAWSLVASVLRGEARRFRALATREENRRKR